jgi:hypothetical protein
MNWRRGFARIWLIVSAVWMVGTVAFAINQWVEYSDGARESWAICREATPPSWCSNRMEFAPPNPFAGYGGGIKTPSIVTEAAIALLPPIFLLGCGLAARWVFVGFRNPN